MGSGRNVRLEQDCVGMIGWFGYLIPDKKNVFLLIKATKEVASCMNFGVNDVWVPGLGKMVPEKVGPFETKDDVSKALQEINNYYLHLRACEKMKKTPRSYREWKEWLERIKKIDSPGIPETQA